MRCWFCLAERPRGDEHVFPLAIGGTLRTDRVCDPCNSLLGAKVDAPLTDHFLVALRRSELRLAGNSGKVPERVDLMFGNSVLASDPSRRMRATLNPDTGKLDIREIYSATNVTLGNGTVARRIIVDRKDAGRLGTILQRERKRAGLVPLPEEELDRQVEELAAGVQTLDNPEVHIQIEVDTITFHRGLFKIAYELACLWLGESYLEDPMAAKLRDFILGKKEGEKAELRGMVEFGAGNPALHFWVEEKNYHIAYSFIVGSDHMAVILRVFDIFSAVVFVTEIANRYADGQFDPRVVRLVHIDPVAGVTRHSSLIEEIERLSGNKRREC